MKGMRIAAMALAVACTMLLASCGQEQQSQQNGAQGPETMSEGVGTKIAVAYGGQADGVLIGGTFASMTDMITREYLDDLGCPVAFNFPAGHGDANYPLLMGAEAHLDVTDGSYALSWN